MTIECRGENLTLSKERAIYWERQKMLIISDLHIGKSAHFRKSGIQVPNTVAHTDLQKLSTLMQEFKPETLLVTGDMFHNNINSDANAFLEWRKSHPSLQIILVKGNHDDLRTEDYEALGIRVCHKALLLAPFRFVHNQPKESDNYYNITGHIHPGVILYGKAKQRLRFPCFYFGTDSAILPAFSVFTGLKVLQPKQGDRFYAITPSKVLSV